MYNNFEIIHTSVHEFKSNSLEYRNRQCSTLAARLTSVSWRAPVESLLVRHAARRPALHLQSHAVDQRKFK